MAKKDRRWRLNGPKKAKWSLTDLAILLGYGEGDEGRAESIRDLVREGRLPRPRGVGSAQYYTGLDVAIILEMFGRWLPQANPGKTGESPAKSGKTRQSPADPESQV